MTQGGFGVVLKIDISATLTAIVDILEVDFPKFTKFIAESTGHDAASGYYEATATGKRRLQPFGLTVAWDSAAATHAEIVNAFDADTAYPMSIEDPDGDEVISFSAHIEEIERMGDQEDVFKAEILVHPTGAPSIA